MTLRILSLFVLAWPITVPSLTAEPISTRSPDQRLQIDFELRTYEGRSAVPQYRITHAGNEIVGYS